MCSALTVITEEFWRMWIGPFQANRNVLNGTGAFGPWYHIQLVQSKTPLKGLVPRHGLQHRHFPLYNSALWVMLNRDNVTQSVLNWSKRWIPFSCPQCMVKGLFSARRCWLVLLVSKTPFLCFTEMAKLLHKSAQKVQTWFAEGSFFFYRMDAVLHFPF